jgi:uncharacterized protein
MMEVIYILFTFTVILLLLRKKIALGYSLLAGSALLALLARMSPMQMVQTSYKALSEPASVTLLATVVLLGVLGYILKETGSLQRMVESLQGLFRSKKAIIGLIPGLIGLVSVPGAAVISAPMIDELGDDLEYAPAKKAAINMLFRHVWFPAYPMSTSLISLAAISGVSIYSLIRFNLPASVVSLVVAVVLLLGRSTSTHGIIAETVHDHGIGESSELPDRSLISVFIASTAPIFISLILVLVLKWPYPISLLFGIASALVINRVSGAREIKSFLIKGLDIKIAMAIVGVMVFKEIVQESGFVINIVTNLVAEGVPLPVLIIVLPMFVALATGSSMAAVAIILPILLPLFPAAPQSIPLLSMMFISSTFGYFFSPLHLCLILTNEYFKTEYTQIYRYAVLPMLAMFITAFVIVFIF